MGRSLFIVLRYLFCALIIGYMGLLYLLMPIEIGNGKVIFFDVGQGDSVFIITPENHQILIDGGVGSRVLEKLAENMSYFDRTLDMLILSHPHRDHVEGLNAVLERYQVENVLINGVRFSDGSYQEFLTLLGDEGANIFFVSPSEDFKFGEVIFNVIYPKRAYDGEVENVNNSSIVLKVSIAGVNILLMGDAESEVENLLTLWGKVNADILKVGHHGSKTSSTVGFLDMVNPEVAVISCGIDNSFGHPHNIVLERLVERGVQVRRTDLEGDIIFEF